MTSISFRAQSCVRFCLYLTLVLLGCFNLVAPATLHAQTLQQSSKYVPDRVLVRFRPSVTPGAMEAAHQAVGSTVLTQLPAVDRLHVVQLAQGMSVHDALRMYRDNPDVLYAEPDYIVRMTATPDDPFFALQWNLHNTGQSGGKPGADIHALEAWALSTGSSNVVVAVLDTGIDYNHPDLMANVWSAPTAFTATSINGIQIQCAAGVHGLNVIDQTCDPFDDNSHGTHVSGIIGAAGNNGVGVAGVNWNVQILPCKFIDSQGFGDISHAVACLGFIKQMKNSGVNVVVSNNSWGGDQISQSLQDAIAAQMADGILFVAASGNDFSDNDFFPFYPADIFLPNVISVAASTRNDDIVSFSNTGRHTVHLAAPGLDILSTTPFNTYSIFSGTSMAAPHVAGVAALLKAQDPTRDWRSIKDLILAGGDTLATMAPTITQKRLNAFGAMTCANSTVNARLLPVPGTIAASVGSPVVLSVENVNCAQPAGNVTVTVTPGNQIITLTDDGAGSDQAAGDGIYTGQFIPSALGSYALQFPDGSTVNVEVLSAYGFKKVPFIYQNITGTSLDLGDDSVAQITAPFPIQFGGGSFNQLFVSSNGTISVTDPYRDFINRFLVPGGFPSFVHEPTTLIAPWWTDLFPVKGTAQNVFWQVIGTAPSRQLVVEWRDVRSFLCRTDSTATITFEAVFNEAGSDIQFNYNDAEFGGDCIAQDYGEGATIGIQSSPANSAMWGAIRSEATGNGTSVLWQSPPPTSAANPLPVLSSMSPTVANQFSPDVVLTVNGSGFVFGSFVQWNGLNLPTHFVSSAQLTATLSSIFFTPLSPFNFGSTAQVTVFNPTPGGGASAPLIFNITSVPGAPSISSVSPNTIVAGGFSFSFKVTGNNLQNANILWNGNTLTTAHPSNTEAIASVSSALITAPGTAQILAVAPGGVSNSVPFTITAPVAPAPPEIRQPGSISIDSTGRITSAFSPSRIRFLGWNYGRILGGPAYVQHFSRPYGGTAPPVPEVLKPNAATSTAASAASAVSLNVPASLPGFALHPTLPAGFLPTGLVTGDFNKDGKMDFVVSNGGDNSLWLYLGNGDGATQLPIIIPITGAAPVQVVAADLRKIGVLDLVVAEVDSESVGVFLGNGDGTFASEVTYFLPRPPLSISVGEFNGDGKPDIVVGLLGDEFSGPLATLLGDGTGKFGAPITFLADNTNLGSFAFTQVIPADLNGDGLTDLIAIDEGGIEDFNGAHVYLSLGDGTFKDAGVFDGGAFTATIGDMDEDGCPDVVTVSPAGLVLIFKGLCDGTLSGFPGVFITAAGEQPASVALADMNGDGHLDVVTAGAFFGDTAPFGAQATNLITVLPGNGHGSLGRANVYRSEPSMFGMAIADLNGDGHPDVMVASQDSDTASIFLNDGQGRFSGPTGEYIGYLDGGTFGTINAPVTDFFVRDIDGDGKPDLALLEQPQQFNASPWELAVMLNDGTGHFSPAIHSPVANGNEVPFGYILGDFRNTGRPDFVVLQFDPFVEGNPSLVFSVNSGRGSFGPSSSIPLDPNLISQFGIMAAGDFNGDGKLDFVLAGRKPLTNDTMQLGMFLGNGDGTFRQGPTQVIATGVAFGSSPRLIFAGDFNNDGKLDLLVWVYDNIIGTLNHNVYELLGNGDGTFQPPKLLFQNFAFFTVADLNHDGLPDIVEYVEPLTTNAALIPYGFNIYLDQPDGSFQLAHTYQPYSGLFSFLYLFDNGSPQQGFSPMVADFNGDGNLDIAAFQFQLTPPASSSYLQILAGNGDGSFTPTYAITPFHKPRIPTTAADVTGDGRADLVEVNGFVSSFHVIPSVPGPALQLTIPVQPIIGPNGTLIVTQSLVSDTASNVTLSASDANITIQPTVTIPAGSLSATVPFTIGNAFNPSRVFSFTAQLGTQTAVIYSHQTTVAFAGFHMVANMVPKKIVPPGGSSFPGGIGIFSYGGYSSTVQFSCQGLPAGVACQFSPGSLGVQPGNGAATSLVLQVNQTVPLGTYNYSVVATDGVVTDVLPLRLLVADFNIALSPASVTVISGKQANFNLTIGSIGGWTDPVSVSCQVSPPSVVPCPVGSPIVFPGTSPASIGTFNVPPGNYTFAASASADGVTRNAAPVVLHVQGVSSTISSNAATIQVGSSASFNLSLNSQNGLTDSFTFSCPNLVAGLSCSFNPPNGTLPAGGALNTVLTVSVTSKPAATIPLSTDRNSPIWLLPVTWALCALLMVALGLRRMVTGLRRPAFATAMSVVALFIAMSLVACGGGGGGGGGTTTGGPPPPPPPPPPPANPRVVVLSVQASSPSVNTTMGFITVTIP